MQAFSRPGPEADEGGAAPRQRDGLKRKAVRELGGGFTRGSPSEELQLGEEANICFLPAPQASVSQPDAAAAHDAGGDPLGIPLRSVRTSR